MKRKASLLLCCIILLLPIFLFGCTQSDNPETPTEQVVHISLNEQIPNAVVGKSYDLSALVNEEEGVKYTYSVGYTEPESGEGKQLTVVRGKITPKAEADISVTVTATRGEESSSISFVVPVSISADMIDKLLSSEGLAGQAAEGVSKIITKENAYLHGENSTSAIAVSFPSVNNGTDILNLSHYSLQAYYTAQVWHNAAVSFWVYNPMEQDVTFKLISHNPATNKTLLWDSGLYCRVGYAYVCPGL